ncbi:MAG: hypothetical protein ACOCRO_11535 [Halanaerobiales bacterium]
MEFMFRLMEESDTTEPSKLPHQFTINANTIENAAEEFVNNKELGGPEIKAVDEYGSQYYVTVWDPYTGKQDTYNVRQTRGLTLIEVYNKNKAKNILLDMYKKSEVCFGEMIKDIVLNGLSITEIIEVYAEMYNEIEGDRLYRIEEDGNKHWIL